MIHFTVKITAFTQSGFTGNRYFRSAYHTTKRIYRPEGCGRLITFSDRLEAGSLVTGDVLKYLKPAGRL